jgi:hypothetical protein
VQQGPMRTTFSLLPEDNPFQDITIGSLLGWGSYGRVHRGGYMSLPESELVTGFMEWGSGVRCWQWRGCAMQALCHGSESRCRLKERGVRWLQWRGCAMQVSKLSMSSPSVVHQLFSPIVLAAACCLPLAVALQATGTAPWLLSRCWSRWRATSTPAAAWSRCCTTGSATPTLWPCLMCVLRCVATA